MNTPSHILLHFGIKKYYKSTKNITIPKSFVFGAVAPDIGLYLCVFLYIPISLYIFGNDISYTFRHMFDTLYFEHPLWIFAYNILHAPLPLLCFLLGARIFQNYLGKYYRMVLWFTLGCMLHSICDIPLHHDDGPRIFYPFSDYSFSSPVSYWDRDHFAGYIIPLEIALNLVILCYIFFSSTFFKQISGKKY